jgi:biopolymer transport protein ExbD
MRSKSTPGSRRAAAAATPSEVIDLSADFDGTLLWNQTPVDRTTMQSYTSQEATKAPQPEVHITVADSQNMKSLAQTSAHLRRLACGRSVS